MIVASLVVKNESDRYLEKCLSGVSKLFDEIFIFDDNSSDDTFEISKCFTNNVFKNDGVSFMEHEGNFRQNAWFKCIDTFDLSNSDWIFVIDADEFFGLEGSEYRNLDDENLICLLRKEISDYVSSSKLSWKVHIPDIQKKENSNFFYRYDGYWNQNYAPRVARASKKMFYKKKMGSFSIPSEYVLKSETRKTPLKLMHLGYLNPRDLQVKYDRYSSLKNHGHNEKHIESIIKSGNFKKWDGKILGV